MSVRKMVVVFAVAVTSSVALSDTINVPGDVAFIQNAIDIAVDGDLVLVDTGVYYETIDFLGKRITVTSLNGPSNTKIDGSASSGPVVSFVNGEAIEVVLEGFTIRNGSGSNGGGVEIIDASPSIRNCLIKGNHTTNNGGGIFIEYGGVQLEDVDIEGNTSGGSGAALYMRFSFATITGGSMLNNVSDLHAGAIYAKDGTGALVLSGVIITGNSAPSNGGAVYAKDSIVTVTDSIFELNSANRGGGWFSYAGGDVTMNNCTFTGNTAADVGGAVDVRSSTATFNQCTFDSNIADSDCDGVGGGGAIDIVNSTVILEDPALCGNLLCDVEDNFSGDDDPVIIGDIVDCTTTDSGACCGGNACWEMAEADCADGGGVWNGDGSLCGIVTCDGGGGEDIGACCIDDTCVMSTELSCSDAFGVFHGTSVTCSAVTCPEGCAADIDGDGLVGVKDLLLMLSAWGVCP